MKKIILLSILMLLVYSPTFAYSNNKDAGKTKISNSNDRLVLLARRSGRSLRTHTTKPSPSTKHTSNKTQDSSSKNSKKGFFGGLLGGLLGGALLGSLFGSAFGGGFGTIIMILILIGIVFIIYKMYKFKREAKIEQLVKERMEKEKNFIHVDPKN